jgi:microcystin-dependent protein
MAKNSFKAKNSLNLEPQTRPVTPELGDMYYDSAKNAVIKYNGYWSATDTKADIAVQADFTSSTLVSLYTENSVITISGTIGAAFNLHGLARNANGKQIIILNNSDQKMVIKNNSLTESTVSARITTPSGNDLNILSKKTCVLFYDDATQKWFANESGGGGGGGTSFDGVQASHGFSVLTPIYHDGTIWVKAQANTSTTLGMYLVTEVTSTGTFTATKFGVSTVTAHGLVVGDYYYVSGTTAGALTATEPLFGYSNPVLYVVDANTVHVMCYRPSLIGDGSVSDSEIGAVVAFPFLSEPAGFLYCDGRTVSRTLYIELFNVIGTSHGVGDGSTTFNLPDYRGRFLRGVDGTAGNDPDKLTRTSTNGGNSGNAPGSVQGDEYKQHTHIQDAHTHGITDPGHHHQEQLDSGTGSATPATLQGGGGLGYTIAPGVYNLSSTPLNTLNSTTGISIAAATATNQNAGTAAETRPKNIAVGYFIRHAARGAIKGQDPLIEVFAMSIRGATAAATGILYYRVPRTMVVQKATMTLFTKGSASGTLTMNIMKNSTPNPTGMTSVLTTPLTMNVTAAVDYAEAVGILLGTILTEGQWLRLDLTSVPTSMGDFYISVYGG